jgi:acetyl-CoA C-acetyltransferase
MEKKVAIVSCGIINYKGQNGVGMWNDEATFKVSRQALDAVGLEREDIDFVVISTMDGLDGITISNGLLAPAAGAYDRSSVRIQTSGIHCLISGVADILTGGSDLVMVASSDTVGANYQYLTNYNKDVYFRGPLGFNGVQSYGLLAMDYMNRNSLDDRVYADAASKNYQAGCLNPYAHVRNDFSTEDVANSEYISWPLRSLEMGQPSNGAVAFILASEERAKELTDNPIWISGVGVASTPYLGSWEELSRVKALEIASAKAYNMAGISNPREEIDLVELCNPFAAFELIAYEKLGLCKQGEAVKMLRDGVTTKDGDLPVNLSGGSICTNPPNSGGLFRIVQATKQLNNEFEEFDTSNAKTALVHDSDMFIGAVGGTSHGVLMLEKGGN